MNIHDRSHGFQFRRASSKHRPKQDCNWATTGTPIYAFRPRLCQNSEAFCQRFGAREALTTKSLFSVAEFPYWDPSRSLALQSPEHWPCAVFCTCGQLVPTGVGAGHMDCVLVVAGMLHFFEPTGYSRWTESLTSGLRHPRRRSLLIRG